MTSVDYTSDILAFISDLVVMEGDYGPKAVITPSLEAWLRRCFPLPEGDPAARNVLDSRSKKQGKSATAGAVALYMAARRRGSEVVIAAADIDQAKDRVLRAVKFAVQNHPAWQGSKVYRDIIELDNGSTIMAIAPDWKGAAGGNYSAVIFDELHAYTYESMRRLYDELVIPPSIKSGVRWIASYAGFTGESKLLEEVWQLAQGGEREAGELPIYHNSAASLLALIDQGEASWRMPWTTPEYMREIQASERPNTYRRLWLNEWVTSESAFLPEGVWDACRDDGVRPLYPGDRRRVVFGADASTSRDLTALVGVTYDEKTKAAEVVYCRVWKPQRGVLRLGKPTIDLDATIKAEILRLHQAGNVVAVVYDPYQLHSIAIDLEKAGVRMIELPQTAARVESDSALYDGIIARAIRHYGDPTLNEHVHNAIAVETARGWRLAKEKTSRKIDACIALSMAHYGAISELKAGGLLVYPNYFYEYDGVPMSEFIQIGSRFEHLPSWEKHHSPGAATWRECTHRTHGCQACIQELTAEGYYEQLEREAERLDTIEYASDEARAASEQFFIRQSYREESERNENEYKDLQSFRAGVRQRLEKRT